MNKIASYAFVIIIKQSIYYYKLHVGMWMQLPMSWFYWKNKWKLAYIFWIWMIFDPETSWVNIHN